MATRGQPEVLVILGTSTGVWMSSKFFRAEDVVLVNFFTYLHLYLGHLADAFTQNIAVVHKDKNRAGFKHS